MKRSPPRLRTKATFYFLIVLFFWSILMVGSLEYLFSRAARESVRERGVHITRALAAECTPLVSYEDTAGVARLLSQQMSSVPDLRFAIVLDEAGSPFWSTFTDGPPSRLVKLVRDSENAERTAVRLVRISHELMYFYAHEREGVRVGVGLSLAPAQQLVWATIPYVIWTGAAGLLAVFALALYVSKPVETLSRAIQRTVLLDRATGGATGFEDVVETSAIASRFHEILDRLEERTKQLDAARKLAYLGEISTAIAHEVNNPLGVIVMNAAFLSKRLKAGALDASAAKEVERLATAAKRATLVVQKFLQFTRYSTRGGEVRHRPTRLDTLVGEALDLLEDRIRLSQCEVHLHAPPDLAPVPCDEQGIQQVIFNLLTNALDASPRGAGIEVVITPKEGAVVVSVSDEGAGMSPTIVRKATEPFFTTKEQGSGLGLAISSSIVRAHGGELRIESEPGKGTIVTFELSTEE